MKPQALVAARLARVDAAGGLQPLIQRQAACRPEDERRCEYLGFEPHAGHLGGPALQRSSNFDAHCTQAACKAPSRKGIRAPRYLLCSCLGNQIGRWGRYHLVSSGATHHRRHHRLPQLQHRLALGLQALRLYLGR